MFETFRTLVIVDIQPEYTGHIDFDVAEMLRWAFVQTRFRNVIYLYNGDSLGLDSEGDVRKWLLEHVEDEDEEEYEQIENGLQWAEWIDKGYGFFRDAYDEGYDEADLVRLGKYMLARDYCDVREMEEDDWDQVGIDGLLAEQYREEAFAFFTPSHVIEVLEGTVRPVLIGGALDECLKEVMLIYEMIDKPYTVYTPYTF